MIVASEATSDHTGHVLLSTLLVLAVLVVVALLEQLGEHRPSAWQATLSVACAGSAAIHLAVTPEHWEVDPLYGVFFLLTSIAQLLAAGWVLVSSWHRLMVATALGSAGLVLLWLQTRLLAVPLGAEAGSREAFGVLDVSSAVLELLAVAAALRLLRPSARAVPVVH